MGKLGARLEFGILGPLEVRRDGESVRIGGPRQRALLALLLCNANRVVSRDQLIDELRIDQAADTAEHSLRVQVSRLRKALGADGDQPRLLSSPPGYMLRVENGELDLHVFEQRLSDGGRALEQDKPEQAAAILREAESLWRGRPLADLELEPFAQFEVQRLDQLRMLAVEERIEAELELGRHATLCPELESLVAEHPLRERLRGELMLALYRSGRQADALDVYRLGRSLLARELALEPGLQLRTLERAILEQDSALEPAPTASSHGLALAVAPPAEAVAAEERRSKPPPHHLWHGGRWAAVALAVGAAVAAFAVAPDHGSSARRQGSLNGQVLALISAGDRSVTATVPLGAPPTDLAAGFGSIWVTEAGAGAVVRIDEARRTVLATIPAGTRPSRIIAARGQIWVLDSVDHTLSAIDPNTDSVAQTIALGSDPSDMVLSDSSLWVANRGDGTVTRLDPRTGLTQQVVRTGGDPSGLATGAGAVWVADDESGDVDRIDARTGTITNKIRVGDAPASIATTPGAVWVLDPLDATLSRVDPRRDAVVATVPIGGAPAALASVDGSVLVADAQRGAVLRVDPRRNVVAGTIQIGDHPRALAADGGLWVALDAAGPIHRGGTLTTSSYAVMDTVDPAAGTSGIASPPQGLGLTNDGLVTVDHVSGSGGTRLVPDLALSLPAPSDAGRTYTFFLRPAIRYSTGATVKASDVTRSFERLFAIGSSGADWFKSILGAAACMRQPADCDLSRGIVADNPTGSVTFHLVRPDPDFLYKLTLTYAYLLPASTPDRLARSPLPATGPYQIARYMPGHEILMTRNPYFREWSAAAQPDGYPSRIVLRLDLSEPRAAAAVATGAADFAANLGQIPGRYAAYFLRHHRGQVRANPAMETSFMFLNTRVPPLNDIRVRRALNLALDRTRIVNSYGGPLAAKPTCQILPPRIPGYRPYCPYTRDPAADGRWRAPNLSRARRLVASSGTIGMKVTVWNVSGPPTNDETGNAVTALTQLGYRASQRLLPDSTYFTYTNDSRNQAQVIDGGWSADFPTAEDFIGKLTCSYFSPRDGLDTTDASEFCDPGLDRQIARADSLQTTNPQAADASWARLDRQLTNLAIWLPTVIPNEVDLVSRRVGNYQYNPAWGALLDQLWVR